MTINIKASKLTNTSSLRTFSTFAISLFLLIMLLSAFFIIPKANQLFESVHAQDVKAELALEAELFTRFVESQQTIIQDLATYPSLTSAVMLSDASDRLVTGLFENVVISGKKSRLVLQNIEGTILIQTDNELRGNYTENQPWIENILSGSIPYHLQLLEQKDSTLIFKMSVPVVYNNYVEGILSSEISVLLEDVFVTQSYNNVAFKLVQNSVTIKTSTDHIEIPRENSLTLTTSNIIFTYITDDRLIEEGKRSLQNSILTVLLVSFGIAFLLFAIVGYRGLKNKDTLKAKSSVWKTYSIPILVGIVGIAASITAYMIASNLKMSEIENELIAESKGKVKALSKKIDVNLHVLDTLKAFYNASNNIDRQEFTTFITQLMDGRQNIQSVQWIPSVNHEQRDVYEEKAKNDGLSHFFIKEKNDNNALVIAKKRNSYLPVYFVEPMLKNNNELGFDFASNSKYFTALEKAKLSGNKVAAVQVTSFDDTQAQTTLLVFQPIYNNKLGMDKTGTEVNLKGFALLVLKVGDLVTDALIDEAGNLSLFIEDISDPKNVAVIHGNQPVNNSFLREEIITVAGMSWRIQTHNNTTKSPLLYSAWLVLISGLILSALVTLGIAHLIRRTEVVEQLVESRTAELKNSEIQHRAVVENVGDGLLTIDELGIIEKFNVAAQRIFGYTAEEVIGKNINMLMPPAIHDVNNEHADYLQTYSDTGVQNIVDIGNKVEGKRKDGTIFPIALSISEMEHDNRTKFIGIVRDITKRVALEIEREKFIDKLTDSNEELARFAFVCSHDLQEPLRMVRSFSEKLQEHLADDLKGDAKGQKYFDFVIDGAARSQTLITDILAYSSISSDTQILETVNIEGIITVIKNNAFNAAEDSKGEITFDSLPELQGNKTQLFQLFQNLINNGLKYQKPDTVPKVHISVEDTGEHWIFAIKDNGIGMEERHLSKIFEVFQRLHRRSKFAGTGVGLSICKKVVERHDGIIWVESEKGTGSTFYIKFIKPTNIEKK